LGVVGLACCSATLGVTTNDATRMTTDRRAGSSTLSCWRPDGHDVAGHHHRVSAVMSQLIAWSTASLAAGFGP
jgi:hypothetical protein